MMSVPAGMEHQIRAVLPHLSIRAQAIVDALWLGGGRMGSATNVARQLGLTSRFALGRMLLQQGLPGLRELADWISVLVWVIAAERSNASLLAISSRSHRNPAVCYRMVKRLTGLTWVELKARGSLWVLRLFVDKCHAISRNPPSQTRQEQVNDSLGHRRQQHEGSRGSADRRLTQYVLMSPKHGMASRRAKS